MTAQLVLWKLGSSSTTYKGLGLRELRASKRSLPPAPGIKLPSSTTSQQAIPIPDPALEPNFPLVKPRIPD
jgi:hypothetical protein